MPTPTTSVSPPNTHPTAWTAAGLFASGVAGFATPPVRTFRAREPAWWSPAIPDIALSCSTPLPASSRLSSARGEDGPRMRAHPSPPPPGPLRVDAGRLTPILSGCTVPTAVATCAREGFASRALTCAAAEAAETTARDGAHAGAGVAATPQHRVVRGVIRGARAAVHRHGLLRWRRPAPAGQAAAWQV